MTSHGFLPEDKTFATRAITTRYNPKQWGSWSVVPPIVLSTTFEQAAPAQPKKIPAAFNLLLINYRNMCMPEAVTQHVKREVLEEVIASLDNAQHALCYSSGLGAVNTISQSLKAGDHLLAMGDVYGGVYRMFDQVLPESGVEVTFIDLVDANVIHKLVKNNTKMLWIETPTNPLLKYVDIELACKIAHEYDLTVVVDNTFLTSYFQKPLTLGADIVIYSLTKYFNGHSDVIMGAVVTNDDKLHEKLKFLQNSCGIVPSPFECYLVLRSLKTMKVRMLHHMNSSLKIAQFLESSPMVERVIHPGLKSHPQYLVAQKQSSGWGGMLAFYIKGGLKESTELMAQLKYFTLAESLGGFESLIEVPSIMTHASVPPEEKIKLRLTDNLIRVSVGLEDPDDLIDDLKRAFENLSYTTKE